MRNIISYIIFLDIYSLQCIELICAPAAHACIPVYLVKYMTLIVNRFEIDGFHRHINVLGDHV